MDGWMVAYLDGWRMDKWVDGLLDSCIVGWMDGCMDSFIVRWMDSRMGGWMNK